MVLFLSLSDRHGRTARSAALCLLVGTGSLACGGKARSPDEGVGPSLGATTYLTDCAEGCDSGLECLGGICTRSCSADAECIDVASAATCLDVPVGGGGMCAIACGSDEDCQYLGAGSYCARAYCVFGDLQALPGAFESLDLRQLDESPGAGGAPGPTCDYSLRFKVNARTRQLMTSSCWPSPAGGYMAETTNLELGPLEMDTIEAAYRELVLSRELDCKPEASIIALDLEPLAGPTMLFADDEHSACPLEGMGRSSYVSGLNDLFDQLAALYAIR